MLYTYQELALAWRVAPRTIQNWIGRDKRRGIVVPRRRRRMGKGRWVVVLTGATADALLRRHDPGLFP
jgi:hypothetical protein